MICLRDSIWDILYIGLLYCGLFSCLFQTAFCFLTHYNDWPMAASHNAAGQEKMRFFEVPFFEWQHRSLLLCLVLNLEFALKPHKGIWLIIGPVAHPYFALLKKKLRSKWNWQDQPFHNMIMSVTDFASSWSYMIHLYHFFLLPAPFVLCIHVLCCLIYDNSARTQHVHSMCVIVSDLTKGMWRKMRGYSKREWSEVAELGKQRFMEGLRRLL